MPLPPPPDFPIQEIAHYREAMDLAQKSLQRTFDEALAIIGNQKLNPAMRIKQLEASRDRFAQYKQDFARAYAGLIAAGGTFIDSSMRFKDLLIEQNDVIERRFAGLQQMENAARNAVPPAEYISDERAFFTHIRETWRMLRGEV